MSNFIGIKPNQVPTNSDLGRLAFLDYVGLEDIGVAIPTLASDTKIYPTTAISYVSGTTTINTIVPPPSFINGGQIVLIPTGLFTISITDNVTVAVTAEVSKAIILIYNAANNKWYPSYSKTGGGGAGGLTPTTFKTTNYTANSGELVRCSTAASPISVTLPSLPSDGDVVGVIDMYNTFTTNPVSVLPNGKTIEGDSSSFILDVSGSYATFIYNSTTSNWKIQNTPTLSSPSAGLIPTTIKTAEYTAAPSELVRCDSSSTAFNVTLPLLPTDGTIVGIIDIYSSFNTNNVTILPNSGATIESDTSLVVDINGSYLTLVYVSANTNWKLMSIPIGLLGNVSTSVSLAGIIKGTGTDLTNATAGTDFVAPGTATAFTKPQRPSLSIDTAPVSNTITWDLTSDQIFRINLTDNITTFNLTGTLSSLVGNQYELVIRYNGGSTISWNTNMKWTSATAPTLTSINNKLDIITFVVMSTDGTNYYLVNTGLKLNVG